MNLIRQFAKVTTFVVAAFAMLFASGCSENTDEPTPGGLSVTPTTSVTFDADGGTMTLTVESDTAWDATTQQDWLTIVEGDTSFELTADPNPDTESRAGEVIVSNGVESVTVSVTQAASEPSEPVQMWYDAGRYWGDQYFGEGTSNIQLVFIDVDPALEPSSGNGLYLDMIAEPMDESKTVEFLEIPAGTYTLNDSNEVNTISVGDYTYMRPFIDFVWADMIPLTEGTVTVEGTRPNYTITVDFPNNGNRVYAQYKGDIKLPNPNYVIPEIDFGTLTKPNIINYHSNPYNDYSVDRWELFASAPEVSVSGTSYMGSGYAFEMSHIFTAIGSGNQIPDGVYTIDYSGDPMTVEGASSTNSSHAGAWVIHLENNLSDVYALVQGTITFSYENGEYTAEIDAVTDLGTVVTGTVKVPWVKESNGNDPLTGTPGDLDYDPTDDDYDI